MDTSRVVSKGLVLALVLAQSSLALGQEVEQAASPTSGWFRVDTDALGTQLWLGATHEVGGIAIASDIYVVGAFAELDVGPSFRFGRLSLTPMVGLGFDFETREAASLIAPQLFTIYDLDGLYMESWIQVFVSSIFDEGAQDVAYTRNFVLYEVNDNVAVGPQVELSYGLNEQAPDAMAGVEGFETGIVSLPVGGRVNLGYGENNTLGLFVGYETQAPDGADAIAGRFTFVRTW